MHRVKIQKFEEEPASLYNHEFEYVGDIENVHQYYDVLLQIKNNKLSGYYLKFNGETIAIRSDGRLARPVKGLFKTHMNLLLELTKT